MVSAVAALEWMDENESEHGKSDPSLSRRPNRNASSRDRFHSEQRHRRRPGLTPTSRGGKRRLRQPMGV